MPSAILADVRPVASEPRKRFASVMTTQLPVFFLLAAPAVLAAAAPAESFLRGLPPGVVVQSSDVISDDQTAAIGDRLGGKIERLTNSQLMVHGAPIQVNGTRAASDADAGTIEKAIGKRPPFSFRDGTLVVEYVGRNLDAALARKTSWELGLIEKPKALRYTVRAELAPVDEADFMQCTPLFNAFLAGADDQITELAENFTFGRTLALRADDRLDVAFSESAGDPVLADGARRWTFEDLPIRPGVPFVEVTASMTVDGSGFTRAAGRPDKAITEATDFWPADDPAIRRAAAGITRGSRTSDDIADAILKWLTPGRNLKYAGETGSRWGAAKVLDQKFGRCWDFSDVFVTMARASGVPARQVGGWLYGSSGHIWAEYWSERGGWQQLDPTGGGQFPCGIYHIPLFTTESGHMPIVYLSMPTIDAEPASE